MRGRLAYPVAAAEPPVRPAINPAVEEGARANRDG
jgi:hypothetical protein